MFIGDFGLRGEGWPVPHRGFDFLDDDIHLSFVQPRVDSNFEEVIDRDFLELILLNFRIGKVISENQRYGSNFINLLSTSLKADFPDAKGFSPRNLARMKKFYETYLDFSNLPTGLAKLPWSFNCLLIDRITNAEKRAWTWRVISTLYLLGVLKADKEQHVHTCPPA